MARKKINYYKFTPGVTGVGTVQIPDQFSLDDILMITNVTRNTVIYNFGDPNRGAYNAASGGTAPALVVDGSAGNTTFSSVVGYASAFYNGVTTLYLRFDTSTHSASDVLQIYIESEELRIRTHDFGIDAVERQRIAIPRSMIDADFEYGLQTTKWAGFTTYRQTPTTFAVDGTDFAVNAYSYVTLIAGEGGVASSGMLSASTSGVAVNSNRAYNLLNQGNIYLAQQAYATSNFGPGSAANASYPQISSQVISNAPIHNLGDYKLVIQQPIGTDGTQSVGPANATWITRRRPITQANGGQFQRTFSVASTAQMLVGDVLVAIGLPRYDQINYATGASITAGEVPFYFTSRAATGVLTANVTFGAPGTAPAIRANTFLAVETNLGSNQFELVFVPTATTAATTITTVLNVLGTNAANSFTAGGRVYCLTPGGITSATGPNSENIAPAAAGAQNTVINSIELMRVDAVDTTTNEVTVTRGWFNTNANVTFGPGTIISTVNLRPGQTYDQWRANCEIVKVNGAQVNGQAAGLASLTTLSGSATFSPASSAGGTAGATLITGVVNYTPADFPLQGLGVPQHSYAGSGTGAVAGIRPGSIMVTLSGMFTLGNTSVPLIGINANNHTIAQFSTSNIGNSWVSTIATTGSYNNANVEGVFMNQLTDQHYIAFFPKNADASRYPGYPQIPPNEITSIAPRFKKGGLFMGANLLHIPGNVQISSNGSATSNIVIRTTHPHGIMPGTPIQVSLGQTSGVGAKVYGSGIFTVTQANATYFSYLSKTLPSGTAVTAAATGYTITANVYPFPTSQVKHRGLDGGTNIGINAPSWGFEATRQTRKYFRYQSGKGMMFTTGTQFNPVFSVANVQANATAIGSNPGITISTINEHGLQRGANIKLYGLNTVGYNDFFTVNQVFGPYVFNVMAKTTLGSQYPSVTGSNIADYSTNARITVTNWWGSRVRSGMFDDSNGIYWEYDGQYLWAVKRSSTYEMPGSISIAVGDNRVVGDPNTRFLDNLNAGDMIQIRGMMHDVISVESQNVLYVTPAFRSAVNATQVVYSVMHETRTRQALFNMDRLDGTGPSGYAIDLSKMQMVGIQYTWYGAGFIDWGMRTTDGKMIWAHRMKNNNRNDEGFMRSGNLPARYQAVNRGPITMLTQSVNSTDTTFRVANIDEFPTTVSATYPAYGMINNEIFSFTGVTNLGIAGATPQGTLTGITRSAEYKPVILNAARSIRGEAARSHTANTSSVMLYGITASPDLNHWGSAVILDGDFDVDRTYSFTYSVNNVSVAAALNVPATLFLIRLSPSLGSGVAADLGARDLLNRAQLLLQNCYINITGARCVLQGIVNPINIDYANWQNVNLLVNQNAPSFAQFAANVTPVTRGALDGGINSHLSQIKWASSATQLPGSFPIVQAGVFVVPYAFGGEQLFSIPVSSTNSGFVDLSKVKEVGGTIVPGNQAYPNGPEIVAFNIVPISSGSLNVDLQVTWIESQA